MEEGAFTRHTIRSLFGSRLFRDPVAKSQRVMFLCLLIPSELAHPAQFANVVTVFWGEK